MVVAIIYNTSNLSPALLLALGNAVLRKEYGAISRNGMAMRVSGREKVSSFAPCQCVYFKEIPVNRSAGSLKFSPNGIQGELATQI